MNNQEIVDFYRSAYKEHGDTVEGMRWGDRDTHLKRLARLQWLVGALGVDIKSILDVGCGIGLLYQVWGLQWSPATYTGVDLVEEYVAHTKSVTASDPRARVYHDDILNLSTDNPFSATLAIGTFAWVDADIVRQILTRMWKLTEEDGVMAFTYLPDNPLSDFEVNRMREVYNVREMLVYGGYSNRLNEKMVIMKKGRSHPGGDYKHREEIEQEVLNGEHRDEEE